MPQAQIIIQNPAVNVEQKVVKVETRGAAGPSAYDAWLSAGNVGDIDDFLDYLITQYGITITAAAGASVPSIAALAAIASPAVGQTAYLYAAGREGWWECKTYSSISALVDADVGFNARSVRSATDSTKAWEREVNNNTYELSWWGVEDGDADNQPELENALLGDIIPAGATLRLPPFAITTSSEIRGERHDLTIEGHGRDISRIVADPGEADFTPLILWGDNLTIRDFGITGNSEPAFANASPCCILGLGTTNTLYENWLIENCAFDDAAIGLICTMSNSLTEGTIPRTIHIRGCRFATKGQGFSIFGGDNVHINDCELDMETSAANNSNCGFRVLGAKNTYIDNVNGVASGEYGILIAPLNRGTGTANLRVQNENVYITNCHITNCHIVGVMVQECIGNLVIDNSSFTADIAGTTENVGLRIDVGSDTGGVTTRVDRIRITRTEFNGFHQLFYSTGPVKRHFARDNMWLGNACTTAVGMPGCFYNSNFGSAEIVDIHENECLQPAGGAMDVLSGVGIICYNQGSQIVRAFDNTLPEGCPTTGVFIGTGGMGTVEGTIDDQRVFPSGSYAAAT